MKKRLSAMILTLMMLLCTSAPHGIAAGEVVPIAPLWTNTSSVFTGITFSSDNAQCVTIINGNSDVTGISATVTLEKKFLIFFYTKVNSWDANVSGKTLSLNKTEPVSGGTYRLSISATVNSPSKGSEKISLTSSEYSY